jgi:hypothetical protein
MKVRPAIIVATLGVALSLAGGCTRTSDGSVVMRRPLFGKLLGFRKDEQQARIVPSRTAQPLPSRAVAAGAAPSAVHRPIVEVPSMQLVKNPPFRTVDPDKPLSCENVKNASGRVRVVCS